MRFGKQRHESKYLAVKYYYEEKQWSVNWMCRQLNISRAAYYKWLHRSVPEQEAENIKLAELIKEYDERFGHILGYRRMTSWINHFNHTSYSKNRIHRIMKKLGIHSIIRKKKQKYQSSRSETTADNKLKRDFNATGPNEKWVTDVTEFKIPETGKKIYLSVIFDLYDRFPVAYVVSSRNDNKLVFDTYDKALRDIRTQNRFFIQTGDTSTQVRCFKASFKSREWINPCPASGTVLIMALWRDYGELSSQKCIVCIK